MMKNIKFILDKSLRYAIIISACDRKVVLNNIVMSSYKRTRNEIIRYDKS